MRWRYDPRFKQAFPQRQRGKDPWAADLVYISTSPEFPNIPPPLVFTFFASLALVRTPYATMFRQTALLALALLPFSFAQVSEDFESGWDQSAWPIYAPDCNQGGKVTLDSSTAHSGKNSVRVDGAGGFCGHIFFGTTKVPSGDIYVRAYM